MWTTPSVVATAVFAALVASSIFFLCSAARKRSRESFEEYSGSDLGILARKNAANILVLRDRVEEIEDTAEEVADLRTAVEQMRAQIDGLAQQNAAMAQAVTGGNDSPLDVTGF